jgi:hypothetical protein
VNAADDQEFIIEEIRNAVESADNKKAPGEDVITGKELAKQLKFKLDKKCFNNQAEQLAFVQAPEAIEILDIMENGPRTAAESQQTL